MTARNSNSSLELDGSELGLRGVRSASYAFLYEMLTIRRKASIPLACSLGASNIRIWHEKTRMPSMCTMQARQQANTAVPWFHVSAEAAVCS